MTPDQVKRKLAAILSADVKGYSRLMGEDEEGTVRRLKTSLEIISGFIEQHRGRIFATGGDSILAEFGSVVDAVRCAVEIQRALKERNKDLSEDRRLEFRIGINLGDVVEDGEQLLGDAVNIAARLESLADAGGICLSGSAYDFVGKRLSLGYEYLGEHTVKNIEKAVQVYRVLLEFEPRPLEPEIRFCVTPEGVRIAYCTLGQGPAVVMVPGWISHLQLYAELPLSRIFWQKIARHHTLVAYDKHGCGLSDRSRTDFSLESELRPLEAVIGHLQLKRFALYGISQSGAVAAAYAAENPRCVSHLILYGAYARGGAIAPDELKVGLKSLIKAHWGIGSKTLADLFLPGGDEASIRWFTRLQREAATQEMAARLMDLTFSLNVVDLLPKVRVPTLVMHRRGDRAIPFQLGRELAAMIPGARFVQLEGNIHFPFFGDGEVIGRTIEEFLNDRGDGLSSHQANNE
jgi:class 3 adenylate cyclase/pimeloyl-ACP methyl ester carboxylesterase